MMLNKKVALILLVLALGIFVYAVSSELFKTDCYYVNVPTIIFEEKLKEDCVDIYPAVSCDDPKAKVNKTDGSCYLKDEYCFNYTQKTKLVKDTLQCLDKNKYLDAVNYKFDFGSYAIQCTIYNYVLVCDSTEDGNGDGVCQSGETCYNFSIDDDKIKLQKVVNGIHDITGKYVKNAYTVKK